MRHWRQVHQYWWQVGMSRVLAILEQWRMISKKWMQIVLFMWEKLFLIFWSLVKLLRVCLKSPTFFVCVLLFLLLTWNISSFGSKILCFSFLLFFFFSLYLFYLILLHFTYFVYSYYILLILFILIIFYLFYLFLLHFTCFIYSYISFYFI